MNKNNEDNNRTTIHSRLSLKWLYYKKSEDYSKLNREDINKVKCVLS